MFHLRPFGWLTVLCALVAPVVGSAQDEQTQMQVQITELGMLRTLMMMERESVDMEDNLAQRFTELDFRVFPEAVMTGPRVTSAQMKAAGEEANADLIVHARTTDRVRGRKEDFVLHEGEAVVQIYSRVSGELLVSQTARANGRRTSDAFEARRSAREAALTKAADQAIARSLAKAHKILVHEAVIVNVFSEGALLAIMEYMGKMEGIYHVRRLSFDRATNEALIEIIGAPHAETTWRAYFEKLPKTRVNVQINPNDALRNKYPSWFQPPVS